MFSQGGVLPQILTLNFPKIALMTALNVTFNSQRNSPISQAPWYSMRMFVCVCLCMCVSV